MIEEPLHDTATVAKRYGVSPRTIRDWIEKGCPTPQGRVKLPAAKFGRGWKIRGEDLLLFEHRVRPRQTRPALDVDEPED
ncbi:helix-turn-helix domain-containing protein [Rhodovulum adriaticum]|uniref:Excisionase family DNA binding protein n=1 Tax=Rhodovulum adriaticum TaxID=35804 RepID=A0A4R2NYE5_RHOAD|nr:helix-turn-helix domain-containing protein [Rhodovulum adriaticum]MBK1634158.1 hypothetical protein [Rhodovulum adriaticum]TCP27293.1 excisionase family DNA binding protein [Rhodovulum adriaticum]